MQRIREIFHKIQDTEYYNMQFKLRGKNKNILFVEPQLSSTGLYKAILPFFCAYTKTADKKEVLVNTAVTGIDKYNPIQQFCALHTVLTDEQIKWSDYIVFPFTMTDISEQYKIKEINPECKTVFCVDFNYYETPETNEYYVYTSQDKTKEIIEKNILNSDICLTSNYELYTYLGGNPKTKGKLTDKITQTRFSSFPYLTSVTLTAQDIDPEDDIAKIQEVKQPIKGEKKPAKKPKAKVVKEVKIPKSTRKTLFDSYNVGIVYNKNNHDGYAYYHSVLKYLNQFSNVTITIIGYNPDEDADNIFDGINYKYVKPTSIVNYFKLLHSLKTDIEHPLDLVFVPLIPNTFNVTSANINTFLECATFGIPLLAPNIFPFKNIIADGQTGLLYSEPQHAISVLEVWLNAKPSLKTVSSACQMSLQDLTFNPKNRQDYIDLFY